MAKYSPGVDCFSVITNGGLWVSGPDLAHLYQAVPLAYLGKRKLDSKPGPSVQSGHQRAINNSACIVLMDDFVLAQVVRCTAVFCLIFSR